MHNVFLIVLVSAAVTLTINLLGWATSGPQYYSQDYSQDYLPSYGAPGDRRESTDSPAQILREETFKSPLIFHLESWQDC